MDVWTVGVLGVLVVVAATTLAPRIGVAAPLILVVLGIGVSFLPFVAPIKIEPEWILGGVLPPLLYSAAVSTPVTDFRRDLPLISAFSVALVAVSTVVVGFVMTWLLPGLPLPLGFALGAIVSPTDAVATSIVRKSGVSQRIVTVLEGESLLNDASALVLLRTAIAATATAVTLWEIAGQFLYAVVVAIVVGVVVGRLNLFIRSHIGPVTSNVAFSLAVPFIAYLPAEHLNASGLVAVVVAGLVSGQGMPRRLAAETRAADRTVWQTIELLLESAVFLIMGLEWYGLVEDTIHGGDSPMVAIGLGVAAATAVLICRTVFVSGSVWALARREHKWAPARERLGHIQARLENGPPDKESIRKRWSQRELALEASSLLSGRNVSGPQDAPKPQDVSRVQGVSAARAMSLAQAVSQLRNVSETGRPRHTHHGHRLTGRQRRRFKIHRARARMDARRGTKADRAQARAAGFERFSELIQRRAADLDYMAAEHFGWREGSLLVWAGMRGAVTLAAAQSLPASVPYRSLLILVAFVVAVGTLLVQGGTLQWLVTTLHLERDDGGDAARAGDLHAHLVKVMLDGLDDPSLKRPDGSAYEPDVLDSARTQLQTLTKPAEENDQTDALRGEVTDLRLELIDRQRHELLRLRRLGTYPSAVLRQAMDTLDADQISIELRAGQGSAE